MNIARILTRARRLIEKPENWTQGLSARGPDGRRVEVYSKEAVSYCALGALCRASTPYGETTAIMALQDGLPDNRRNISGFNDDLKTTHADVLAVFDRAIAKAYEEGR